MSLMSNLYLGNTGLRIASNSLNTTAHNVTNTDTDGYTRQQVSLSTSPYVTISKEYAIGYSQLGLGVNYAETRQVRDYFLDVNYRRESGRSEFYETSVDALHQVEDILGESTGGTTFTQAMNNLWEAAQELIKDPCNEVNQNLLVTRSYEFITRAGDVYNSLADYQLNLNIDIRDSVNDINDMAARLEELNNAIVQIESGVENANDLRDERNHIIDKLGQYGNITWDENLEGYVSVKFEGTDLVKGGIVNQMALYQDPQTDFYHVYWAQNAEYTRNSDGDRVVIPSTVPEAYVFDLKRPISSELCTDVGSLKAALYARGDHNATFKDLNDPIVYDREISQSVLMNVEAEFDSLIHNITTSINSILMDAADKSEVSFPGADNYLKNADGTYLQLFQLKVGDNNVFAADRTPDTDSINDYKLYDYWNGTNYYVSEDGRNVYPTDGFTVSNIMINMELRQSPSALGFRLADGNEDRATMERLSTAFTEEVYTLNPKVTTPVSFTTFYNSMVSQVASSGEVYNTIKDAQDQTINSIENARQQILGVNTDEELTFMIQFQNAYNAASRYINVVDEMLEHLLTSLG